MNTLHEAAAEVGVNERTLRRAIARGLIRAQRPSPRRLDLSPRERWYVSSHWPAIAALLRILRTRHDVRLAVVYGSFARGDDHVRSDIDLVVRLAGHDPLAAGRLGRLFREETGRTIQLTVFGDAAEAPLLLADVLRDGRVLVDRDGAWPVLMSARRRIAHAAGEADAAIDDEIERLAGSLRGT